MLHGETSAGLPRMKSAERLRRRKKSKHQQKLCLLHRKSHMGHSEACAGIDHPDGISVVDANGLGTPRRGHSPPTPSEGILLRPTTMEDTEILNSPCIDEGRLFV